MGKRSSAGKPLSARKADQQDVEQRAGDSDAAEPSLPDLLGATALDAGDASGSDDDSEAGSGSDDEGSESPDDDDFASGSDDESASGEDTDDELDAAVLDYAAAASAEPAAVRTSEGAEGAASEDGPAAVADAAAQERDDPASSSSDDEERPNRNTVGETPLEWYKDEEHIGYDKDGSRIIKKGKRDKLDALLARNDGSQWRTVYDEYNDEEVTLSKEEMQMIQRIRAGQFPHVEVNPYEPEVDWFTRDPELHPLSSAPEPKRRFQPSKWEEKKIVKLVRALRKGWIKRDRQVAPQEPATYLMWDEDLQTEDKTLAGLTRITAPKPKLPGHEASYNPPKEYLPTEEEKAEHEQADEDDRPDLVPTAFDSLRLVPSYAAFIKERFERCLDLYLCPRVRQRRVHIQDPRSLLPTLPKPRDLQPFPTRLAKRFTGHTAQVTGVAVDGSGQWLASASQDGTARVWEVATGRCMRTWQLGSGGLAVAWCPDPAVRLASAVTRDRAVLLVFETGEAELDAATAAAVELPGGGREAGAGGVTWSPRPDGGLDILHKQPLASLAWHARGDYFATVAPAGNTQAVMVHQLSKKATQNPFRKNKGRVVRVLFHPSQPLFFVASQNHVRVYNLVKQQLVRKLLGGAGRFTSLALHPSGDHVLTGGEDKRVAWYDMELSTKPYRALRYHRGAVRAAAFHRSYPLFASASDDGSVHVFHGMVYQDLMTNPLIVPVKSLRGHSVVDFQGVLDVAFHPSQPWLVTAGADTNIFLFTD